MKTRDQSIFDEMFKQSLLLGYKTFDYRPTDESAYPFVQMETSETNFSPNKSNILGTVYLRLNVWGLQKKRKEVSEMANALFGRAFELKQSDGYKWALNTQASQIRMLDDTSTNTPLKRAVIELEFRLR